MIEVRTDNKLDTVLDTDPRAVELTANLLGAFVDFEIPGVGIDHDSTVIMDAAAIHESHRRLVLDAIGAIDPPILADSHFRDAVLTNFGLGAEAHTDFVGHYPTIGQQIMRLKLHTAVSNGADIIFANAGLGHITDIGDRMLFDESGIPCRKVLDHGYDYEESEGLIEDYRIFQLEKDSFDPIYIEPNVYLHRQNPMCSVLFRALTSMGPATAHKFRAVNPDIGREVLVSELSLYGQVFDLPAEMDT